MSKESSHEVNFDGIIGPTHNYGSISYGNVASTKSQGSPSNPREAVIQGIEKAYALSRLGVKQALIPPHERPYMPLLRKIGFCGTDVKILEDLAKEDPQLLVSVSSAAGMWTANAATVAPSSDTMDGKLHIVPASLAEKFHRSIESTHVKNTFSTVFSDLVSEDLAIIHDSLPIHPFLGDEGAANHMRFSKTYSDPGIHLFVYGQSSNSIIKPKTYPARQTLSASKSIARIQNLPQENVFFAQQNPDSIDAGIFHNDVISVNGLNVWLLHEMAYLDTQKIVDDIKIKMGGDIYLAIANTKDFPLEDVVNSYAFNSQIIQSPDGSVSIIAPTASESNPFARQYLENIVKDPANPISSIKYFDLTQSMKNGGGPACLRLRIVMKESEINKVNCRIFLNNDEELYHDLISWANRNYRDYLSLDDLRDPSLMLQNKVALDELTQIMRLGSLYEFQK